MTKEKKAAVSLRLNVRPLGSNWKAVKRVEFTGSPEPYEPPSSQSPAHDQLDNKVWKTKVVRTEFVKQPSSKSCKPIISVFESEDENEPETHKPDPCTESKVNIFGVVEPCKCKKCIGANDTETSCEISPVAPVKNIEPDKKQKKEKEDEHKYDEVSPVGDEDIEIKITKKSDKAARNQKPTRKPTHHSERSTKSAPAMGWKKLYKPKRKDPRKEPLILCATSDSVSEHSPSPAPPPPPPTAANSRFNQFPSIAKVPVRSELTDGSDSEKEKPKERIFEVPPPDTRPVGLTMRKMKHGLKVRDSIEVARLHPDPKPVKEGTLLPPVLKINAAEKAATSSSKSNSEVPLEEKVPVTILSEPIETAIRTEPRPVSEKNRKNTLKKIESLFYEAEANMWMFILLVFLTILSYRFSIDPHTCYYD